MTTKNTHKVLSWDGTRKSFPSVAEALTWARGHLRHWMEDGDRLVSWPTPKGHTFLAVSVCGEPTDAAVLIGAIK